MTKEREALKLALDTLISYRTVIKKYGYAFEKGEASIAAIEEALAQPEQEPVACDCRLQADECNGDTATFHPFQVGASCSTCPCERVYTTQPKRKPLTDGQKRELIKKSELWDMHVHIGWYSAPSKSFVEKAIQLISEIEAAHDIKETQ